jgi:hypothetical protein
MDADSIKMRVLAECDAHDAYGGRPTLAALVALYVATFITHPCEDGTEVQMARDAVTAIIEGSTP